MVRLQHKHRRDGVILVGGGKFPLDAEGCVEVPEAAAEKLKQGALWGEPGSWPRSSPAIVAPPTVGGARRPRTREELMALAEAEGLSSPSSSPAPISAPAPAPIPPPAPEVLRAVPAKRGPKPKSPARPPSPPESASEEVLDEAVIRISRDTPKDDLVRVAKQLGLEIPKYANQEMVFELIKKAHGERT